MADPKVEALLRRINRLVVDDLRGRDVPSTGNQLPVPTLEEERLLALLADSRDIPARLAPSPAAILGRESAATQRRAERESDRRAKQQPAGPYDDLPFEEAVDERRAISRVLTDMVALCADSLQPLTEQPAPADPDQRDRIGWATSRAYARSAVRRLAPGLFANGRVDDLGLHQPSVLEGDVAAAHALAAAVGARLGESGDQILRKLAAAGQGATAPAVAELLLPRNRHYATLPPPEQEALVRLAAQRLESGFASRDERGAAERELTEVVENRREDIAGRTLKDGTVTLGGATSVDSMGVWADDQIEKLHVVFAALPDTHPAKRAPAIARAKSVYDLSLRIHSAVGDLTGTTDSLWRNRIEQALAEPPDPAVSPVDYSVRLGRDAALALRELTVEGADGPLSPEQAAAARAAIADVTAAYTRLAVPAGYAWRNEERADTVAPRFLPLYAGTSDALAGIANDEVIDRIVPAELAEQLRAAEPPHRDTEYARAVLAFATAVDDAREPGFPNETLRRMAGQGRAGVAIAAAHRLVDGSRIARHEQPFAIRVVAETIDTYFDDLPAQIERWRGGEAGHGAEYGEQVAQRGLELVQGYEAEPGRARRDSLEADRKADRPVRPATVAPAVRLEQAATQPASTFELMQRIQGAVGELSGAPDSLWTGAYDATLRDGVPAPAADGVLRVSFGADLALAQLSANADRHALLTALRDQSGNITVEQLTAARDGIADATGSFADWAVPAGHSAEAEARAEADPQYDVIAAARRGAFVYDNFDEVLGAVLPDAQAARIRTVGHPELPDYAPAALSLAQSIDEATGQSVHPSDTLRRLAGVPRADIARVAAEARVPAAAVPDAADRINRAFQVLPAQVAAWRSAGATPAELGFKVHEYGHALAQEVAELGRPTGIAADPHLRFAHDPASASPGGRPAAGATAGGAATTQQPKETGRDR